MKTKHASKPKRKALVKTGKVKIIHTTSEREFEKLTEKFLAGKLPGVKGVQLD